MDPSYIENMSLNCTDARPNQQIERVERTNISSRVLQCLEQELEQFEKISILFLISADIPGIYEKIMDICKNIHERPNIISEFVQNNLDQWGEKMLEALCLINNREVLKNLGFSPSHIAVQYYQDTTRVTVKMHVLSKVLYKLFETMDTTKAKKLLHYIYDEDRIDRQLQDDHYLELHALYWLHIKYITISPGGRGDLTKLLKHLKKLDYHDQLIYQDVAFFSTSCSQSDSCSAGNPVSNRCIEAPVQNNTRSMNGILPVYTIKKGLCIIFNEVNFPRNVVKELQYEKREGSDKDRDDLRRTFTGLGFDVVAHDDLTEDEMFQTLKDVSKNFDLKTHDCLVVCILSHGYEGGIVSSDGHEISIAVLEDAVCTSKLQDVIKILIIQACQGKITGDMSQNSNLALDGGNFENIRHLRNLATFMSTINRYNSIRHKKTGSWFIQAVCSVLSNCEESISVGQLSAAVNAKVTNQVGCVNNCRFASQIPELRFRLEAEVYFPPYNRNTVVDMNALL